MPHPDKKEGRSLSAQMTQMTWRDYCMIANMVLFIVVGGLMLYRAFSQNASLIAYLMGSGFIFAGGYRLYLFYHVLVRNVDARD